jgi:hypothetical protein
MRQCALCNGLIEDVTVINHGEDAVGLRVG